MFAEARQQEIAAYIQEHGSISIAEIVEKYGVSGESARRDLRALEQAKQCKRTHGGAVQVHQVGMRPPLDRNFDAMPIDPHYDRIAAQAAALIQPGDTAYLTGGSFGFLLLRHLPTELPCTLVVNNVDLANRLRAFPHADVYLAGGLMRKSGSVVDSMARDFVSRLHFDLSLLTGAGFTADFGLSNGTDETASFQRQIILNSRRNVALMPSAKVGADAFVKVCDADAFDLLITDWDCVPDELDKLREQGVNVLVAEETTPEQEA